MDASIFVILLTVVSLAGLGGIILASQRQKFRHLENQSDGVDVDQLTDAMASMNENVSRLEAEVSDLSERLEFNEKLLSRRAGEDPRHG